MRTLLASTLALLLAACSADDAATREPASSLPLTLRVASTPYVAPDGSRAAIVTTPSLSAFSLNYSYGETLSSDDIHASADTTRSWTTDGGWPVGGSTVVNWYAKSAGTFHGDNGFYVDFTMEEDATKQCDLLVATASGSYASTGGTISLTFSHVCTALRFYVKKSANLADYTLTITRVQLCNVLKSGEYHYDSSSWTTLHAPATFTLYDGSPLTLGTTDYVALDATSAPYLFVIPQTLTPWDGTTPVSTTASTYLRLTLTLTRTSDSLPVHSGTAYIPLGATLTAGHQHNVRINIGRNTLYSNASTKIIP